MTLRTVSLLNSAPVTTDTMYPNYRTMPDRPKPVDATTGVDEAKNDVKSLVRFACLAPDQTPVLADNQSAFLRLVPQPVPSSPFFRTANVPDAGWVGLYMPGAKVHVASVAQAFQRLPCEQQEWLSKPFFWSRTPEGNLSYPYAVRSAVCDADREKSKDRFQLDLTYPEALLAEAYEALLALDHALHTCAVTYWLTDKALFLPAQCAAFAVSGGIVPARGRMWALTWL